MKRTVSAAVLASLLFAGSAYAQGSATGTETRPEPRPATHGAPLMRPEARQGERPMRDAAQMHIGERRELMHQGPEARKAFNAENFEERRAILMEKRAQLASSTKERKEMLKEKLSENTGRHFDRIISLLNAMVLRLTGLADRIGARIDVLAAAGGDTEAAEAALGSARTKIAAAEDAVEAFSDAITEALASENRKEALMNVRPAGQAAKEALRAAHEALRSAHQALPRPAAAE